MAVKASETRNSAAVKASLRSFHGKVVRSSDEKTIKSLFEQMETELGEADSSQLSQLISDKKPIPITGLFTQTSRYDAQMTYGGNIVSVSRHSFDLFGYCRATPLVVRIRGWKPTIIARVPTGATKAEFMEHVGDALSSIEGRDSRGGLVTYRSREEKKPYFGHFEFGRWATYVVLLVNNADHMRKCREAIQTAFGVLWSEIEREPSRLDTAWKRSMHALELKIYPLYFSKNYSDHDIVYQFMSETGLSLCGHHWLRRYTPFDPRKEGYLGRYGVEVEWSTDLLDGWVNGSGPTGSGPTGSGPTEPPIAAREIEKVSDDYFSNALCIPFDIETAYGRSAVSRKISDPRVPADYIMTIGLHLYRVGSITPLLSISLLDGAHRPSSIEEGLTILCEEVAADVAEFKKKEPGITKEEARQKGREKTMQKLFIGILRYSGCSFVNTYNGEEFDLRYILVRAEANNLREQLYSAFDNYADVSTVAKRVRFDYNATFKMDGINRDGLHRPRTTQKGVADTFLYVARLHPKELQESKSLNAMLKFQRVLDPETGVQLTKFDMPIKRMYELWEENKPEGIHDVAKYCLIDAKGSYLLLKNINQFQEAFVLANHNYTLIPDSLHRADGMRVIQALSRKCREMGFAFVDETPGSEYRDYDDEIDKIGGGDVRVIVPGRYMFMISLDYASMYPSRKEDTNIGGASKVLPSMIEESAKWDLVIVKEEDVTDQYCSAEIEGRATRKRYWIARKEDLADGSVSPITTQADLEREYAHGHVYKVEQFYGEAEGKSWKTYYVQSRRGTVVTKPDGRKEVHLSRTGPLLDHYSVQCEWLTAKRAERAFEKAEMGKYYRKAKELRAQMTALRSAGKEVPLELVEAEANASAMAEVKNVKQNNIKRMMNSEYGIGANKVFPTFDLDVAATVTYTSRRLAEFLRRMLTTDVIYLPEFVVEKVAGLVGSLQEALGDKIKLEKVSRPANDAWTDYTGKPIIEVRLIEEERGVSGSLQWYKLTIPPSVVHYQDTDSNYYRNQAIVDAFSSSEWTAKPVERARKIVGALLDHNDLMAILLREIIGRPPTAVSCDGGFITCYYSPQKKQYMGIKCPGSREELKNIGERHLKPILSTYDGSQAVSRYLAERDVKVTGYLIIRRDTPMYIIKAMLRYCEKLLSSTEDVDVIKSAYGLIDECVERLRSLRKEDYADYSKTQKYNPMADNDVRTIVRRLREERKDHLVPTEYAVTRYVLVREGDTGDNVRGTLDKSKKRDRMRLLTEIYEAFENAKTGGGEVSVSSSSVSSSSVSSSSPPVQIDSEAYVRKLARALTNLVYEEVLVDAWRKLEAAASTSDVAKKRFLEKRERYSRLLEDYKEAAKGRDKGVVKKALDKVIVATVAELVSKYYAIEGNSRELRENYRSARDIVVNLTVGCADVRSRMKKALDASFDRSTPVGKKAQELVAGEAAQAKRQRRLIEGETHRQISAINGLPTESSRRRYVENIMKSLAADVQRTHSELVALFSRFIERLHEVSEPMTRALLAGRGSGTGLTSESIGHIIPPSMSNGGPEALAFEELKNSLMLKAAEFKSALIKDLSFQEALKKLQREQ